MQKKHDSMLANFPLCQTTPTTTTTLFSDFGLHKLTEVLQRIQDSICPTIIIYLAKKIRPIV